MAATPPTLLNSNEFSLLPAIFVPFPGIRVDDPRPKDRDGKLRRILADLDKHHDAVRQNMFKLVKQIKEKLISEAQEAAKIERESKTYSEGKPINNSHITEDELGIEEILTNLRTPPVKGQHWREYLYDEDEILVPSRSGGKAGIDADGDTPMEGTGSDRSQVTSIHRRLCIALQELTIRAAAEMEAYDKHAEATMDYYRRALERGLARQGSNTDAVAGSQAVRTPPTPTAGSGRGILLNKQEEIRIDREVMGSMAEEEQSLSQSYPTGNTSEASRDPGSHFVDVSRDPRRGLTDGGRDQRKVAFDYSAYTNRR